MTETQRIPKWLRQESFVLFNDPKGRTRVQIFGLGKVFDGYGSSISEAAKEARKKREAAK